MEPLFLDARTLSGDIVYINIQSIDYYSSTLTQEGAKALVCAGGEKLYLDCSLEHVHKAVKEIINGSR